jgi:peptide/nickel transport system permease protein
VTSYIARRLVAFVPLLLVISVITFVIIELPPGDYLTTYILQLEEQGTQLTMEEIGNLTRFYGLDKPIYGRYLKWISNILLHGNLGWSFAYQRAVSTLVAERVGTTVMLSMVTLVFTYVVAIPIGILSAVKQYSPFDYFFTFVGFIGLAVPNFLLALVLLWLSFKYLGLTVTGLFSFQYVDAPWTLAKVGDLFAHIWVPVIVIGTAGMAGLIRVMRGCLLDELTRQYVITARAKGVREARLLFKYPVRLALNPIVSGIGWLLPAIVSGAVITSIVLNLPTLGPLLLGALNSQDMYLAGSIVLILSFLVLIGNLISDILLAWLDPRISFKGLGE